MFPAIGKHVSLYHVDAPPGLTPASLMTRSLLGSSHTRPPWAPVSQSEAGLARSDQSEAGTIPGPGTRPPNLPASAQSLHSELRISTRAHVVAECRNVTWIRQTAIFFSNWTFLIRLKQYLMLFCRTDFRSPFFRLTKLMGVPCARFLKTTHLSRP